MDKTKSVTEIYDKIAEEYAKSFKESPEETEIIKQFIKLLPKNAKVLDVGCGNSDYYELLKKNKVDYTGIDLSEEMIKIAKQTYPKGNLILMDMKKINFQQNSFDAIFCFYSLIHIAKEEVDSILKKFSEILKENGKLLLALQEGEGEVFEDEPFLPGYKMFINLFSEKEIKNKLQKHKFKIIKLSRKPSLSDKEFKYDKLYILASK